MYCLYILTLFIFAEARWHQQENGYHKPTKTNIANPEAIIEEIANHLRIADGIVANSCNDFNNERETYDSDGYILKYILQKDLEEFVNIKIKNSVMVIKAGFQGGNEFSAMKILPSNLETRDAIWWIEGEDLVITIPYKVKLGIDIPMKCEKWDVEIDVPLSPEYSVYQFLNMNIYGKPEVTKVFV
ncbi:unnamed protein product [Pieris macdunnoughi]|uniref:Uncharacterized protein n=1 Tax=Pieris macdunnoughi TaxID=345717 RepID=A0A821SUU5_9NEOP|nr:unnamed protein product [Pieris macdunnoughi]